MGVSLEATTLLIVAFLAVIGVIVLWIIADSLPKVIRVWKRKTRLQEEEFVRASVACAMWAISHKKKFVVDSQTLRQICYVIINEDMIWWSLQDNAFFMDPPVEDARAQIFRDVMNAWIKSDHSGHWKVMFASTRKDS